MFHTKYAVLAISALLVLGADPASAKSGAALNAPAQAKTGQRYIVSATGGSDSFGGATYRMCIDKKMGNTWRPQACINLTGSRIGTTHTNQPSVAAPGNVQYSVAFYRITDSKLFSRGPMKTVRIVR